MKKSKFINIAVCDTTVVVAVLSFFSSFAKAQPLDSAQIAFNKKTEVNRTVPGKENIWYQLKSSGLIDGLSNSGQMVFDDWRYYGQSIRFYPDQPTQITTGEGSPDPTKQTKNITVLIGPEANQNLPKYIIASLDTLNMEFTVKTLIPDENLVDVITGYQQRKPWIQKVWIHGNGNWGIMAYDKYGAVDSYWNERIGANFTVTDTVEDGEKVQRVDLKYRFYEGGTLEDIGGGLGLPLGGQVYFAFTIPDSKGPSISMESVAQVTEGKGIKPSGPCLVFTVSDEKNTSKSSRTGA